MYVCMYVCISKFIFILKHKIILNIYEPFDIAKRNY
jgi:hypothetical protein